VPLCLHLQQYAVGWHGWGVTGQQEIRLLDQNGKQVQTACVVVEGSDWVSVINACDRVVLSWDASAAGGPAKVALGWSGGLRVHELNDWTLEPQVLTVEPLAPSASARATSPGKAIME
jgi:hypothetical protein